MAVKKTHTAYFPLPTRSWAQRAGLITLVTLGLAFMVMSKTNNPAMLHLRTAIADRAVPVLATLARPMDAMSDAGAWLHDMAQLRAENIELRNQNIQLLQWQQAAKAMDAENNSLRNLLHVVAAQKNSYITARVVSDIGGPYVHSALIGGGSDAGIKKDQAVINDNGLMGRVVETGAGSARVLLLSDINSRVPVMAERAHEKSILTGNNSDLPTLSYLSGSSHIAVGERIVTSGDGGVFPQGIPVGIVTAIDNGVVKVQPFVDPAKAQYVSVVDYSL